MDDTTKQILAEYAASADRIVGAAQARQPKATAIRITYQGNVITSAARRTTRENFEYAVQALGLALDIDPTVLFIETYDGKTVFEQEGGKVEAYRSY